MSELLRRHAVRDKRLLVETAYRLAIAGDVRWAEWIARHSGESALAAAGREIRDSQVVVIRQAPALGVQDRRRPPYTVL